MTSALPDARLRGSRWTVTARVVGVVAVWVAATVFSPATVHAEDGSARGAARALGYAGVEDYQKGRYDAAADKLERAYSVIRAPALGLWSARALVKQGKLVEAAERYLEVTRLEVSSGEIAVQKRAQTDAAVERTQLLPRIPSLVIVLEGTSADAVQVTVDGKEVPAALVGAKLPSNPGAHHVEARHELTSASKDVTLAEAETESVTLMLRLPKAPIAETRELAKASTLPGEAETPPSNGKAQRTIGWVVLAVGGVGLVTSGVTTGLALKKKSDIDGSCEDDRCSPSVRSDVDDYNTLRTLSTVSLAAGVLGVGSGLVLLFTAPKQRESAATGVRPWVGVASAGIAGVFQ